jgi:hypothetical protein
MWRFFQTQVAPSRGKLELWRAGGASAVPRPIKA